MSPGHVHEEDMMHRATRAWLWLLSHVPSIRETSYGLADGQAGLTPVSGNRHYMNGYRLGQSRRKEA